MEKINDLKDVESLVLNDVLNSLNETILETLQEEIKKKAENNEQQ